MRNAFLAACLVAFTTVEASAAELPVGLKSTVSRVSEKCDTYRWWGQSLCGLTIFVEPQSRDFWIANLGDNRISYEGTWPQDRLIANTNVQWDNVEHAMVMLPLPEDPDSADTLVAHENFHRIEQKLPFSAGPFQSAQHLETENGRISLRLELALLRQAISAGSPEERRGAAAAAVKYRSWRMDMVGAQQSETHLVIKEGLAEFAGMKTAGIETTRGRLVRALSDADGKSSYVRSFAYYTGPAWAYLLELNIPNWHALIDGKEDLADIYSRNVLNGDLAGALSDSELEKKVKDEEHARAEKVASKVAALKQRFQELPQLILKGGSFSFNPNQSTALGEAGTVFETFNMKGEWGVFDTQNGALVSNDYSFVSVDIIVRGGVPLLENPNWSLKLAEGWQVAKSGKDYTLVKR